MTKAVQKAKKSKRLPRRLKLMLELWPEYPTFEEVAEVMEVKRNLLRAQHNNWYEVDDDYRAAFDEVETAAFEKTLKEIRRRGIKGVTRKKFHRGFPLIDPETEEQYEETEFSDTLLLAYAKLQRPEAFRDQQDVRVEHSGGIDLPAILEEMHNDPDYVEFIRQKTFGEAADSSDHRLPLQSEEVEAGEASDPTGSADCPSD